MSSGPDGIVYAGINHQDHTEIGVLRLFLAQRDAVRWRAICERMALIGHLAADAVLRPRFWQPDAPDPYLVTPRYGRTLSALIGAVDRNTAIELTIGMADALSEAHKLGFAHGRLCPSEIPIDHLDRPLVDLFGLQVGTPPHTQHDLACLRDSDGSVHPQAADVFSLGTLTVTLLTNRPQGEGRAQNVDDNAMTQVADAGTRLSALLHEMLGTDPDSRPSMHEVVARLRRGEVSQLFTVLSPGVEASPKADTDDSAPDTGGASELERGQQVGRYVLGPLLGEGGMGRVFRAIDQSNGEQVALKVLHHRWSTDDQALRRFYREARLLSQLKNQHIAHFIDANEVDGMHYLAMEFVDGKSLHEVLEDESTINVDLALSITRDVALALADVHDLGIIHRDIKPANILLLGEGKDRRAKLCDFGIAREVSVEQELTTAGLTVGTPHYMAPEQCVGDEACAASDVYALGITLLQDARRLCAFQCKGCAGDRFQTPHRAGAGHPERGERGHRARRSRVAPHARKTDRWTHRKRASSAGGA